MTQELQSRHLFDMSIDLHSIDTLGKTPAGERRIISVAGERVDPSENYLRIAPFFETAAPKYSWLNNIVSIGVGERTPMGASYQVFEIL